MTEENKEISVGICTLGSRIEPMTLTFGDTISRVTGLGIEWLFFFTTTSSIVDVCHQSLFKAVSGSKYVITTDS